MADENVPIKGLAAVPDTLAFQLQLGADGACRLILLDVEGGATRPIAILTLPSDAADRLAQEMADRRATYDKRRNAKGEAKH